jgi:hypothetical protein
MISFEAGLPLLLLLLLSLQRFIQIYDEEYDIIQAKRQIQYQLVIHLLKCQCLYDYSLTYIHV